MHYASNHVTQLSSDGSYVSHARCVQGSVVARSRTDSHIDFHAQNGVQYVSRGQSNQLSYQMTQRKGKQSGKGKGSKLGASAPTLSPPNASSSDINWSPVPRRHASASENLCVALYCDDGWDDVEDSSSELPSGRSSGTNLPSCSTTPRPERPTLRSLTFSDELPENNLPDPGSVSPPLSPALQLRPYTNPGDTPTRHSPTHHSPVRRLAPVPAHDLTLESLHDLNWLHKMEPEDQMVLEVHVIWSILSLMVVLLACYTFHHQPLTG